MAHENKKQHQRPRYIHKRRCEKKKNVDREIMINDQVIIDLSKDNLLTQREIKQYRNLMADPDYSMYLLEPLTT